MALALQLVTQYYLTEGILRTRGIIAFLGFCISSGSNYLLMFTGAGGTLHLLRGQTTSPSLQGSHYLVLMCSRGQWGPGRPRPWAEGPGQAWAQR